MSSSQFTVMGSSYSSSYKVLSFDQCSKLDTLMQTDIVIHGQGTYPDITVALKDFVMDLKSRLQKAEVSLEYVRLNGSTASFVVASRQADDIGYNDLDLIFGLKEADEQMFNQVREILYATLRALLPEDPVFEQDSTIEDGFVQKMVKISNQNDCWSLISLHNNTGKNVEVKYVNSMKRQYEFSVDSFQIELDSLLEYYECKPEVNFTKDFYPCVRAESKYGKFDEALFHLNNKLIATLRPEEIRGGGLLKYCNLLLNNYNLADSDIKNLERYMCSRFFIDFPDANSQQNKLQAYMRTHIHEPHTNSSSEHNRITVEQHRINFIIIVKRVIDESTVCLMNIERACTLSLLDNLIGELVRSYMAKYPGKYLETADSGYFSDLSSINSISPSHFSRSSSPGFSGSSSRSPSPATFGIIGSHNGANCYGGAYMYHSNSHQYQSLKPRAGFNRNKNHKQHYHQQHHGHHNQNHHHQQQQHQQQQQQQQQQRFYSSYYQNQNPDPGTGHGHVFIEAPLAC
jgi:hypothetical protein